MTDATVTMLLSESWLIVASACFLIAGVLGVLSTIQRMAKRKLAPKDEAILDWRPTLRMDAHLSKFGWIVRSQDIRLIASVSGEPHAELRWRASSLDEVKRFVSVYHKAMHEQIEKRAKNHRSPELPHASPADPV